MPLATGTALALGAALGAAKYESDNQSANRQRKLNAAITTYSPWTGMKPNAVTEPNPFGSILQGTAAAGSLNQGLGGAASAGASSAPASYGAQGPQFDNAGNMQFGAPQAPQQNPFMYGNYQPFGK